MKITFNNKSESDVILILQDTEIRNEVIAKGESKEYEIFAENPKLILIPDGKSEITYLIEKVGIISKRSFVTTTEYSFTPVDDMVIELTTDKRKGSFRDEYERILPVSSQCEFKAVKYCVSDALRIRKILEDAINKGDIGLKLFNVFDILGNSLTGLLLLVIPFILIWIFGDIQLAAKICGIAFIPIFIVIVCINRFFDKLKRKLWKQAKGYVPRNQIFKDYNSYFDNEYISSVFSNNKRSK